jgi:hypothetical protein
MTVTPDLLRRTLEADGADTTWLDAALATIADRPLAIGRFFPAAGRRCGRAPLSTLDGWTVDDAARVLLLTGLSLRGAALASAAEALYRYGDAAEKRAVLRALPLLDGLGADAVPLLHDALRTNDSRLVAAALGPCATHLPDADWRQAVLKCVFMSIPLAVVADLDTRADTTLAAMLARYADERRAAGRTMPADALALLDRLAKGGVA